MTGITQISRRDVTGKFTRCCYSIVTGCTITNEGTMVNDRYRHPGTGVMTGITLGRGGNMRCRFTGSNDIVMTAGTGTDHLAVVYAQRCG